MKDISFLFYSCGLEDLTMKNWFDFSKVTTMYSMFNNCTSLTKLNLEFWETNNLESIAYMFYNCKRLTELKVSQWITSKIVNMQYLFYKCEALTKVNLKNWDARSIQPGGIDYFAEDANIVSYVDGMDYDSVASYNIKILNNLKYGGRPFGLDYDNPINRASLRALINGLADLNTMSINPQTLGLPLSTLSKLYQSDIAVATEKGWTLVAM